MLALLATTDEKVTTKKGGDTVAIKPKEYAEAIRAAQGFISVAAENLGCKRTAIYSAARRHKIVQEAIDDSREKMTDFVEGKLYQRIEDEDTASIIFFLKTRAKDRGYVEKVQVEHAVAAELEAMLEIISGIVDGSTYDRILAGLSGRSAEAAIEAPRALN